MHRSSYHFTTLREQPKLRSLVAEWIADHWSDVIDYTTAFNKLAECLKNTSSDCHIAEFEGRAVGTATIFQNDMTTRPDLSPWLTDVYVIPEFRGRGIAAALIGEAMSSLAETGFTHCYLWTRDQKLIDYYAARSWEILESVHYRIAPAVIMSLDLKGLGRGKNR